MNKKKYRSVKEYMFRKTLGKFQMFLKIEVLSGKFCRHTLFKVHDLLITSCELIPQRAKKALSLALFFKEQ